MSPPSSLFESFERLAGQGPGRPALYECSGTHRSSRRALLNQAARVNVSGRKVDPREVELALGDLAGVRDAVVGGTADDRRGESLVAYVVAEPRVTRAKVLSHLRSSLASWKLPRDVVFLNDLPRNARGKPDMRALSAARRQLHLPGGEK